MAEQNDIQQPTSQTATAAAAAGAADAAATEPASEALAAAPASAATSTVPEISPAPALVPTEAPQNEISRSEGSESSAPEIKLPPAAQIAEPAPSMLRPFRSERPNAPPKAAPAKAAPAKPAPAKPAQSKSRFPLLAATLGLSAGLGAAAGAALIPGLVKLAFPPSPTVTPAQETAAEISAIRGLAAQLASDLSAFRNTVELSSRTTAVQFGKLTERLDRAERAQAEPGAKLAKIGEAVERLERRAGTPGHNEVTGSINPPQPQAEKPETKPKPAIIEDYVVRRVFDGVALVEGRRGIIEVEPGSNLPGAGRVEEIRRQDGRWVVVTTKGLIVPAR